MTIRNVDLAAPPQVLQVRPGDTIRVHCEFDYSGPAVSGRVRAAMYTWTLVDPHNEKAFGHQPFSIPLTEGVHVDSNVTIVLPTSGLPYGLHYGLYFKVVDIPGGDIFSPYYGEQDAWIIEVMGPVQDFSNLVISSYSRT